MRISTALNHRDRLTRVCNDVVASARYSCITHGEMLAQREERIHKDPAWPKLPEWVKQSVREAFDHACKALYKPDVYPSDIDRIASGALKHSDLRYVRWAHKLDGEVYWNSSTFSGTDWDRVQSAFVWNHDPSKLFSSDGWRDINGDVKVDTEAG